MATVNLINAQEYDFANNNIRTFFRNRGFVEVPVEHRLTHELSPLVACEDPTNVTPFMYSGVLQLLPQTGQMWLEWELLHNPHIPGFYCHSTSFRDEKNPIDGRHDLIFPMFEFETHGDIETLVRLETDLLLHLGFTGFEGKKIFQHVNYANMVDYLQVKEITAEHEDRIWKGFGYDTFFLKYFPQYTSPFWNMKKVGDSANKVDVILYGMETIGSAERSTDPEEMRYLFHTISDGMYAEELYKKLGKERIEYALELFLSLPMVTRCGGGIGMTRMIRALKHAGIMPSFPLYH